MPDAPKARAWEYRGESTYVEGVPFGEEMRPGDHYVSVTPMSPADINLASRARAEAAIAATWQRALRMHLEASVVVGTVGEAMEAAYQGSRGRHARRGRRPADGGGTLLTRRCRWPRRRATGTMCSDDLLRTLT